MLENLIRGVGEPCEDVVFVRRARAAAAQSAARAPLRRNASRSNAFPAEHPRRPEWRRQPRIRRAHADNEAKRWRRATGFRSDATNLWRLRQWPE